MNFRWKIMETTMIGRMTTTAPAVGTGVLAEYREGQIDKSKSFRQIAPARPQARRKRG
jgi:hypothetical protein